MAWSSSTGSCCQTRHFSGCSQRKAFWLRRRFRLSDPPFQRVFTAYASHWKFTVMAVRPAISAGVHSWWPATTANCRAVRPAISAGVHSRAWLNGHTAPGCQTRHFSGCSQPSTSTTETNHELSDPPFQRVFTAVHREGTGALVLSDPPFQRVFTALRTPKHKNDFGCQTRHFSGCSQRARRSVGSPRGCQTRHFSGCSQPESPRTGRWWTLSDPPFQRVFTARPRRQNILWRAVRPAISAGVHSANELHQLRFGSCQTRHFSGCSQRSARSHGETTRLSDPPFQRVFTACLAEHIKNYCAVRPAISAGVHSSTDLIIEYAKKLSDPPFQRVFTAQRFAGPRGWGLSDPPFQRVFTAAKPPCVSSSIAVRPAISAGVHSPPSWPFRIS